MPSAYLLFTRHVAIHELKATGKFESVGISADEDEHSIEMHLPYVRKIFQGYGLPNVLV